MLRDGRFRRWDVCGGWQGWSLRNGRCRSEIQRRSGGHHRPGVQEAPTPAASHTCGTRKTRQVPAAWGRAGRPTVREAEFSAGNKMPKKRMPVAPITVSPPPAGRSMTVDESQQETRGIPAAPPGRRLWITGRIPGLDAWALNEALTWAGEPLKNKCPNPGTEGQVRHRW
jgi:hypothetical protein